MLTQPTLTEKIIKSISYVGDIVNYPKSESQFAYWLDNHFYREHKRANAQQKRMRKRINEALLRLKKAQVISYSQQTQSYQLTSRGWLKYLYYNAFRLPKKEPIKSQNKYVIIFDIPEKFKRFRDLFRRCLQNQESRMLQKSVFICPNQQVFLWAKKVVYNCELNEHVLFIEANRVYK